MENKLMDFVKSELTEEELDAFIKNGLTVTFIKDLSESYYLGDNGEILSETELKWYYDNDAECKEYCAEEGYDTFEEYIDALTDMGGYFCPSYEHFEALLNGERIAERRYYFEEAVTDALDYIKANGHAAIEIARVTND